ncbi:MAG: PH domain-containing protein [Bacillota bacterium]|nr:PH domain-containing protein [Bacillota bacterium]
MGFFDGLLGNATEVDIDKIEEELQIILTDGEEVQRAYVVIRDSYVFTNKRLLLIDKQGMTGKKIEYHSIPYKSITHFSIETAGHFDFDAELRVWVAGNQEPIIKQFKDKVIYNVQKALSYYVLNL